MSLTFKQGCVLGAIFLFGAAALAEAYMAAGWWVRTPWIAAALVNTVAGGIAWYFYKRGQLDARWPLPARFNARKYAYLPAAVVVSGAIMLAVVSRFAVDGDPFQYDVPLGWAHLGWVLWVPIVEELTFRVGVGGLLRRVGGLVWGTYVSVILFSFMHSIPTVERFIAGDIGVGIGTLLLGASCEILWLYTRRIGAIYCLHAACNFTVVIFSRVDPRWLSWLDPLYL